MIIYQKYWGFGLLVVFILLGYRASFAAELIMVERPNCEWCEIWEKEVGVVYKLTPQGKRAPIRRLTLKNLEKSAIQTLSPVTFTPTFILLSKQGEIGRITGYPGESHFWALLESILKRLPETPTQRCPSNRLKFNQVRMPAGKHVC
tara:strand:- start:1591 stop:2031 length:441 start_codon:yes stop_codon:yes gene_type:complete